MATLTVRGNQTNQPEIVGGPKDGQPKSDRTAAKVRYNLPAMLLPLLLAGLVSCAGVTSPGSKSGGGPQSSPTTLASSSSALTFGQEPLGKTSTAQTITITNTGSAQANIQSISCNNSSFTYNGPALPAALPPSQSVQVSVAFDPKAPGSVSGVLSVASDATDSTLGVNLSGQGAAPVVSVSPASIPFGDEVVNSKSSSHTVTVSNTGLLAMNVSQVSVSASQFIASGPAAPYTIQPGSSVNYAVAFNPTAAQGYSGSLSIASNAFNGPASASLSGTGISASTATVSVSPGALSFSSMPVGSASNPQMVTIKNTGSSQATIQTISSNNASFSYSGISLPAGIGPSSSVQLAVSFDPKSPGAASGNLSISGNANNLPTSVGLTGTGEAAVISVGPSSVNFGNETQNVTSGSQSISVSNTGNASLSINSVGISPAQFAYSGPTPPFTILPGNSVTYNVTFTPAATQAYSGSMSFTSNAFSGNGSVSMSGTGVGATSVLNIFPSSIPFANQLVNTTSLPQSVSVQNGGNTSVTISQVSVPSGPFAVTGFSGNTTLATGQSMPLSVTYTPNAETGDSATLNVSGTSSDGSPVSASVNLTGIGVTQSSSVPNCGLNNNQNPYIPGTSPSGGTNDWDTFAAPGLGGHYVDKLSGCWITRITDNNANNTEWTEYYSTTEPFNSDDSLIALGRGAIVAGPTFPGQPMGSVIVPHANLPEFSYAGNFYVWSWTNPNQFYAAGGNASGGGNKLLLFTINGLPGCASTHNCTVTSQTIADFTSSGGSTGKGYISVGFIDEYDMSYPYIPFAGLNPVTNTIDVDVYNLATNTNTVWYTSTCTQSGGLGPQPGCVHKLQMFSDGTPAVGFATKGLGVEQGVIWMHGTPGSPTQTHLEDGDAHYDTGQDINGTNMYIVEGLAAGLTTPCPDLQFTGQTSASPGATLLYRTDPMNTGRTAVCVWDALWASLEISNRATPSRPWWVPSVGDTRTKSPEYFNTNSNYIAPTCTQTNTVTSGSCWYPFEDEILMVKTSTNMNILGLTPLSTVYRLGWARSRADVAGGGGAPAGAFWATPKAAVSRDGNYIVFDSNMAFPSGSCSSSMKTNIGCADVYVLTAPGGGPIF